MSSKKSQQIDHPLKAAMDRNGHSISDIAALCDVSKQSVYDWLQFDSRPSANNAITLAGYCGADVGTFVADWEIARQQALEERRAQL